MVRSFCGNKALGNLHKIHWHKNTDGCASNCETPLSNTHPQAIDVHITPIDNTSTNQHHYDLQCFKNGHPIQFCGSGTLAAAHALKAAGVNIKPLIFTQHGRTLHILQNKEQLGFKTPAPTIKTETNTTLWARIVGQLTVEVSVVGDVQGYAIVELSCATQVKTARIDFDYYR